MFFGHVQVKRFPFFRPHWYPAFAKDTLNLCQNCHFLCIYLKMMLLTPRRILIHQYMILWLLKYGMGWVWPQLVLMKTPFLRLSSRFPRRHFHSATIGKALSIVGKVPEQCLLCLLPTLDQTCIYIGQSCLLSRNKHTNKDEPAHLWSDVYVKPFGHNMDQLPCLDLYDKAALSIFKEWGIDPDGPVEDDCINPVYRFPPIGFIS